MREGGEAERGWLSIEAMRTSSVVIAAAVAAPVVSGAPFPAAAFVVPAPAATASVATAMALPNRPVPSADFAAAFDPSEYDGMYADAAAFEEDVDEMFALFSLNDTARDLTMTSVYLSGERPPGSLLPIHVGQAWVTCHYWADRAASYGNGGDCYAWKEEGAEEALHPAEVVERIVERLEREREVVGWCEKRVPFSNLYYYAIDAWVESGRPDAADRARAVLDKFIPPLPDPEDPDKVDKEETALWAIGNRIHWSSYSPQFWRKFHLERIDKKVNTFS